MCGYLDALTVGAIAPAVIDAAQRIAADEAEAQAHAAMGATVFPDPDGPVLAPPHGEHFTIHDDGIARRRLDLPIEADTTPFILPDRHTLLPDGLADKLGEPYSRLTEGHRPLF